MNKDKDKLFPTLNIVSVQIMTDIARHCLLPSNDGRNRKWSLTRRQSEVIAQAIYDYQNKGIL